MLYTYIINIDYAPAPSCCLVVLYERVSGRQLAATMYLEKPKPITSD